MSARITLWRSHDPPDQTALCALLHAEGMDCYPWSNRPNDLYNAHAHFFDKVIYVLAGSITFILPEVNQLHTLKPGDRIDLPAGTFHSAVVGPQGVTCLEGHRAGD